MRNSPYDERSTVSCTLVCLSLVVSPLTLAAQDADIVQHFKRMTGATEWQLAGTIALPFQTHHPQGMVIVGDNIFFSSVEVTLPTERYERPAGRYDRTPGEGVGHLFRVDRDGNLIARITLGEGSVYHPGGIDFDGRFIWVPVAEYRPNSRSIIYRVDPSTMAVTEVLSVDDHIGAIVHDTASAMLHGVSWASRFFYAWELDDSFELAVSESGPAARRVPNGSHYVDYQDCHYVADHQMLCGGVATHEVRAVGDSAGHEFTLGGLDLIDLQSQRAVHQVPIAWRTESGIAMSRNAFFVELGDDHLRFFFLPEDDESTIYIFEAFPG